MELSASWDLELTLRQLVATPHQTSSTAQRTTTSFIKWVILLNPANATIFPLSRERWTPEQPLPTLPGITSPFGASMGVLLTATAKPWSHIDPGLHGCTSCGGLRVQANPVSAMNRVSFPATSPIPSFLIPRQLRCCTLSLPTQRRLHHGLRRRTCCGF